MIVVLFVLSVIFHAYLFVDYFFPDPSYTLLKACQVWVSNNSCETAWNLQIIPSGIVDERVSSRRLNPYAIEEVGQLIVTMEEVCKYNEIFDQEKCKIMCGC